MRHWQDRRWACPVRHGLHDLTAIEGQLEALFLLFPSEEGRAGRGGGGGGGGGGYAELPHWRFVIWLP